MTYTIAVCTVKNSWWWTDEFSETCRVSFQNKFEKSVHLVGFIIRNSGVLNVHTKMVINILTHPMLLFELWAYILGLKHVGNWHVLKGQTFICEKPWYSIKHKGTVSTRFEINTFQISQVHKLFVKEAFVGEMYTFQFRTASQLVVT